MTFPNVHLWHPVGQLNNVKLPTVRPGGRLGAKQPDCWPGSHQIVSIHLQAINLILLSPTQSYLSWHCGPDFDIAPVLHCKVGGSCPDILCLNLAGGDSSIGVLLCLDRDLTTVGVLTH